MLLSPPKFASTPPKFGRPWLAVMLLHVTLFFGQAHAQTVGPVRPTRLVQTIGDDLAISDFVFGRISGLAVAQSGRFFVMDAGECHIKAFDDRGTYLRAFGRAGGGPGEFSCPGTEVAVEDSLLVVQDLQQRRVSRFTFDGRLRATVRLEGNSSPTTLERSYSLRSGARLAVTGARIGTGASNLNSLVMLHSPAGRVDTLARIRSDVVLVTFPTGLGGPSPAGFGAGGGWAVFRDSLVAIADGYAAVVRWHDVSNDPARVVRTERIAATAREVSGTDLAAMEARLRRDASPQSQVRRPDATFVEAPSRWSVATRAVFGQDGTLFVAGGRRVEPVTEWTAFPATGAPYRFQLPSAFFLTGSVGRRIYGWSRTNLGNQIVQIYELR